MVFLSHGSSLCYVILSVFDRALSGWKYIFRFEIKDGHFPKAPRGSINCLNVQIYVSLKVLQKIRWDIVSPEFSRRSRRSLQTFQEETRLLGSSFSFGFLEAPLAWLYPSSPILTFCINVLLIFL